MARVKRLVLDVLKPHHPNLVDFAKLLAEQGGHLVKLRVLEMDEATETVQIVIEGSAIDFERLQAAITDFGASLHSVDEVDAEGEPEQPA